MAMDPTRNMTVEEMEARLEEIQKEHQSGTLPDEAYADEIDDDGSNPEVVEGAEEGKDKEQPEGKDKEVDSEPATDGDEDADDPEKEGDSDDNKADKEADKTFDTEGLTDTEKNRVQAAQRRMHQATQQLAEEQRRREQLEKQLASQGETPAAKKPVPKIKLPDIQGMTEEQAAQFKEDYPDIAPMIDTIVALQQHNAAMEQQLSEFGQGLEKNAEQNSYKNFMETIKAAHADSEEIRTSDEWLGWLEGQPKYVRDAINVKGTAEDVISIISSYKKDMGITAAQPEPTQKTGEKPKPSKLEQAKQGASPNLPGAARQHKPGNKSRGKMYTRTEIAQKQKDVEFIMSDEGQKWVDDVQKAAGEGRIID